MQIVFHIGAHNTDDDLLVQTLLRNSERLAKAGTLVPAPAKYRAVLRDTLLALKGKLASEEIQDVVLDTILEDAQGERLVFSFEHFICVPQMIFEGGVYYSKMAQKATWLRNLFPDFNVEFQIGLRDPATQVPAIYDRLKDAPDFATWRQGIDETTLRWERVIGQLRQAVPDSPVTLWCNEDTPLIWPEVLRALAAHPADIALEGEDALLEKIMTAQGMTRMRAYFDAHPPRSTVQRRRVVTAFLDKFAIAEAVEEEYDLPGWTAEVMDRLTECYDADVQALTGMPGVTVLQP